MRYCSACGTLNETDAKFCAGCGKRLGAGFEVKNEDTVKEDIENTQEIPAQEICVSSPQPDTGSAAQESLQADAQNPAQDPVSVQVAKGDHRVKGRVCGIIGFAMGIEALICCWMPYANFIALIEAIAGLILCRISKNNTDFRLARVGKTLNLIALVFSIITIILYIVLLVLLVVNYGDDLSDIINQSTDGMVNIYFGY